MLRWKSALCQEMFTRRLDMKRKTVKKAIQNLVPNKYKLPFGDVKPSLNQEALHKETVFLIEPGLYGFLLRCKKPKAVPFTEWVVETVLPREVRKLTSVIEEKNNQQKISRLND